MSTPTVATPVAEPVTGVAVDTPALLMADCLRDNTMMACTFKRRYSAMVYANVAAFTKVEANVLFWRFLFEVSSGAFWMNDYHVFQHLVSNVDRNAVVDGAVCSSNHASN